MSDLSDPMARVAEEIIDLIDELDRPSLKEDGQRVQRALERALTEANKVIRERRHRVTAQAASVL